MSTVFTVSTISTLSTVYTISTVSTVSIVSTVSSVYTVYSILYTRLSCVLCQAPGTIPGFWNWVDWRLLVKLRTPTITKLTIKFFKKYFFWNFQGEPQQQKFQKLNRCIRIDFLPVYAVSISYASAVNPILHLFPWPSSCLLTPNQPWPCWVCNSSYGSWELKYVQRNFQNFRGKIIIHDILAKKRQIKFFW